MPLPDYVEPYWPAIQKAAKKYELDPYIIAAMGDRETRWGTSPWCRPKGPECLGDFGHGHGLMQIDDRFHSQFTNSEDWKDPEKNICYACGLLHGLYDEFLEFQYRLEPHVAMQCAIAAYNCGAGNVRKALKAHKSPDTYTAHGDYSYDVLLRAERFRA